MHTPGGLREEHGGLARRVAGAHDDDLFLGAQLRFHGGRGVVHPRAFEPRQVVDRKPPILGARRDDHHARRQPLPVADLEGVRSALAGELRRGLGDHHLSTELLRLRERPVRQLLAGDPHREAEVVLDSGARAGLATGRGRLHDQDVQSLRRPVHRRREPGRSRAHDHEVPDVGLIDRVVEAQRVGDLLSARASEHDVATDNDGHVVGTDVETIEHGFDVGLAIEVHHRVGMPVSGEELADMERSLAVTRPEDHHVADLASQQLHPAQDEGAHEDLAQLAVGLHERQQVVTGDFDDLAGRRGPDMGEPTAARQHGDFATEHPGAERYHEVPLGGRRTDAVDLALHDDEQARHRLARVHQHLARLDPAAAPVRRDPGELRHGERGINVVATRGGVGRGGGSQLGGHRSLWWWNLRPNYLPRQRRGLSQDNLRRSPQSSSFARARSARIAQDDSAGRLR